MKKNNWISALSIFGVLVAMVVPALPAQAQQEGAAGAFLEEIVTTARKRSTAEAVQDVPVAVSAFGADQQSGQLAVGQ